MLDTARKAYVLCRYYGHLPLPSVQPTQKIFPKKSFPSCVRASNILRFTLRALAPGPLALLMGAGGGWSQARILSQKHFFPKESAMPDFSQLTERQREIYEFIRSKIESRGYGPTVREIGA